MAFVVDDRVRVISSATGTGPMGGLTTVSGYRNFSFVGSGDTVPYAIVCRDTAQWEVGLGTYAAGALTRAAVLSSSSANAVVNFGAGTKDIFCTLPAVLTMTTGGGIFTGPIQVPEGAAGAQVPRVMDIGNLAVAQRGDIYRRGNIIGAVGQTGGVPTGAVIQRIDTATPTVRRRVTRFADGTQILTARILVDYAVNTPYGSIYSAGPFGIVFDTNFIEPPDLTCNAFSSLNAPVWASSGTAYTTSAEEMYMFSAANNATARLSITAIGRWY